ncbi:GNAT family N-acetyltransferase [Rhizobium sp. BG4]|uniref:GNAT family N-acetyltransferase n=1 Tax=Rhizobium sp. BG4 TaxID=2613770 RepID=UPI00193E1561|nr:GNAT family N-acetyltransferase [Rhizobium sp. BG4]QRM45615.1 GNAT family N-acetyltransferase [Rhizobium sp. BG4]
MDIVRLDEGFGRWSELVELILSSFAHMNGRIDPPSSALDLTPDALRAKAVAEIGYVALQDGAIAGCMFLRPESACLYLGKLAVAPELQGRGIGKQLLAVAEAVARERSLETIRLDTRIELTGNHAAFAAMGFVRTAEKSHPGFDRVTYVEMRKTLA